MLQCCRLAGGILNDNVALRATILNSDAGVGAGLPPGVCGVLLDHPAPDNLPAALLLQVDRNDDMLRSCLRAIDAISRIPDAEGVPAFKGLLTNTVRGGLLAPKFAAVQQERIEAAGAAAMDMSA